MYRKKENKAIFGLGMPPVTGSKSGQIKSLNTLSVFSFFLHVLTSVEDIRRGSVYKCKSGWGAGVAA